VVAGRHSVRERMRRDMAHPYRLRRVVDAMDDVHSQIEIEKANVWSNTDYDTFHCQEGDHQTLVCRSGDA
jgi:hypothetical protein